MVFPWFFSEPVPYYYAKLMLYWSISALKLLEFAPTTVPKKPKKKCGLQPAFLAGSNFPLGFY